MSDEILKRTPFAPYFTARAASDNDRAAECYTLDALWMRPVDSGGIETFHGREEIRTFFKEQSPTAHRHFVRAAVVEGRSCSIEGLVELAPDQFAFFMTSGTFTEDGLISRSVTLRTPVDQEMLSILEKGWSAAG